MSNSQHELTVLSLEGDLSYEKILYLQSNLTSYFKHKPHGNILLNFSELDFVGSSGIGTLVGLLNEYNRARVCIHIEGIRSEFIKVFRLYGLQALEVVCQLDKPTSPELEVQTQKR